MAIRLRLALWYGALLAVILVIVGLLSYAFHARGHYDDVDRALITNAAHAINEATTTSGVHHLGEARGGLEVAVRLYDAHGVLLDSSVGADALPPIDPHQILAQPRGPAFDAIAGLVPPRTLPTPTPEQGAFGLLTTPEQRWRVYVLPITRADAPTEYVAALMPLGRLDASIQTYRLLLLALGLGGILLALGGSWAIAGRALAPLARMTETAHAIAHTRSFGRRIDPPPRQDELGRLAATFNEMLASLEEAYRAQQRFVSDASHELRAPLTAIQGNLELFRRQPAMAQVDREEALAEVEREATRLSRLVADLLALARADAGVTVAHRPVDLDALVLDAFRTARALSKGHDLRLDPFEPVQVIGDADRLTQLVLILLDNALKYTPPGGHVVLGLAAGDSCAVLSVQDNGVGIPPQDLPHVFERFYRADPARGRDPGGTGLGLPIAHWIVDQHGGSIELASRPGQGTTVTVCLSVAR